MPSYSGTSISARAVPNLVQGVSQQSVKLRKDSQCESQFDCINSAADGCFARGGAVLLSAFLGRQYAGCAYRVVTRGPTEQYLVVISSTDVTAFNLLTGAECTVVIQDASAKSYLLLGNAARRDRLSFQGVNDTLFIASYAVIPRMTTAVSEVRPPEAMLFFRAGGYSMTFSTKITFLGVDHTYTFTTNDNSVAANAAGIATNYLAAVFYKGLAVDLTGQPPGATVSGVTAAATPDVALPAGFSFTLAGNLIRIWRVDGQDFSISTSDAVSDGYLIGIKDFVPSFQTLPKGGFVGFRVAVSGQLKDSDVQYYLHFVQPATGDGFWEECAGPDVHTDLDPATMPVILVNDDVNHFVLKNAVWDSRIAGDEDSAKDPSFVNSRISDMFYRQNRLGILTNGTASWSKTANPFDHFPDTVQTVLATDRIDQSVSATDTTPVLDYALCGDEGLFFWSQKSQFRVSSGQDPLRSDTVQILESTTYEYAPDCRPRVIGKAVYFVGASAADSGFFTNGDFGSLVVIPLQNGVPLPEAVLSDHVPAYIPATARQIEGDPVRHFIFIRTDANVSQLLCYNSIIQQNQVVQSAWNTWRLPTGSNLLWCGIVGSRLCLLVQRDDGVFITNIPLSAHVTDDGGDYFTRLDLRVDDTQCSVGYNSGADLTTITLPYSVPEAAADPTKFLVVARSTAKFNRGAIFPVLFAGGNTVSVRGDLTGQPIYAGFRIVSERTESAFYLRGPQGFTPVDDLVLRTFRVDHELSVNYRIEVTRSNGHVTVEEYDSRTSGLSSSVPGAPVPRDGYQEADIDADNTEVSVRIVNDSPFPSKWQTAEWKFNPVERANLT